MEKWMYICLWLLVALMIVWFSAWTIRACLSMYGYTPTHERCEDYQVIWQGGTQEYNPSIAWVPESGEMLIALRKSKLTLADFPQYWTNIYLSLLDMQAERTVIYKLNLTDSSCRRTTLQFPACEYVLKSVYEDPRLYRLADNRYVFYATCFPKQGGLHLALVHLSVTTTSTTVTKVVPMDHAYGKMMEKNWTIFWCPAMKEHLVLSDIYPVVRVRRVNFDTGGHAIVSETDSAKKIPFECRCTSSPVPWDDHSFLVCAHYKFIPFKTYLGLRAIRTNFVWIRNRPPFDVLGYSPPIQFFRKSLVEYASGLLTNASRSTYWIGMGYDDKSSFVLRVPRSTIERFRVERQ